MKASAQSIVRAMQEPNFYPHPVAEVQLEETHASWVFLAGDFAYKLKKPVDFGFLDFSTPAKRRYFCEEELRLNRRFAPELYLAVVPLGGPPGGWRLDGSPVRDHAVKMRRFPAGQRLDRLHAAGRLTAAHLEQFAGIVARFHDRADAAPADNDYGTPAAVLAPAEENFTQLRPLLPEALASAVADLESWTRQTFRAHHSRFARRKQQGSIRECHGDLHLGNMVWYRDRPLMFDCIEFDPNLRWIDPINDIAFLLMDLEDRGESALAWRFLNGYLQASGDFAGLPLLPFYKVYRALVRAKVISLRLAQADLSTAEKAEEEALVRSYLALAESYTRPVRPRLFLTHGLSGSGKTTFVKEFAPLYGAVCLCSDVERKRLHGLAATADSASAVGAGLYGNTATKATYRRLQELADGLLAAGLPVVVDATFSKQWQRTALRQVAERHGLDCRILDFPRSRPQLLQNIERRQAQAENISEATAEVLDAQLVQAEPLLAEEKNASLTVLVETSAEEVVAKLRAAEASGVA